MPMKRKNKCRRTGNGEQPWFKGNRQRQRRRKVIAKASQKANRPK